MQSRGLVAQLDQGNSDRTSRAQPRRAFRPKFARRTPADMAPPKRTHQVVPLGDGTYRLITTVTAERVVTAEGLRRYGIAPPLSPTVEVPWKEAPPLPVPPRGLAPFGQVMTFWRQCFPSFPSQMPSRVPAWLDIHGLDVLLRVIAEVKAETPKETAPPYLRLVRKLNQLRREQQEGGA
jgi:hypothetical protein